MANEITYTASLSFAKGNVATVTRVKNAGTITVSGTRYYSAVQTIGTSEEALGIGELGSLGLCWAKNLDATNFVHIKTATGGINMVKLKPGEAVMFRFGSGVTAPYAIADTASVQLEYMIVED